jgi:hypothetical protein
MPMYRCLNCKGEFQADKPACAACELDATTNPRDAQYIVELAVIHYDPPTRIAGRGKNVAACDPKIRVGLRAGAGPGAMLSGEKGAVTCPACKASEAFTADADPGMLALPVQPLG